MARVAAGGQTAEEMDKGLNFTGESKERVAENYHLILAKYENNNIMSIANKVYVMKGYELQNSYNEILSKKFLSPAESIDFGQRKIAAEAINTWIRSKTNNAIDSLVKPDILSSDTRLFLLSAIHFKGKWKMPFSVKDTKEHEFYVDEIHSVKVQMMSTKGFVDFGLLYDLQATALRLPYQDTDLSMLIILPRKRNGLAALEEKLRHVSLPALTKEIKSAMNVKVFLPKYKAEFEIVLNDVLKKLGMEQMFSSNADFSKMLKSPQELSVDAVIHKAFIEVSEKGTDAAAATGAVVGFRSGPRIFKADHPFYYVIMDAESIPLFQGTFMGI